MNFEEFMDLAAEISGEKGMYVYNVGNIGIVAEDNGQTYFFGQKSVKGIEAYTMIAMYAEPETGEIEILADKEFDEAPNEETIRNFIENN